MRHQRGPITPELNLFTFNYQPWSGCLKYDLVCGAPILGRTIIGQLRSCQFELDPSATLKLVVDDPPGLALRWMERAAVFDRPAHSVVRTLSPCPEYWEYLWDMHPQILLVGVLEVTELAESLLRAERGESYRYTPDRKSPLTRAERRILRYVAEGWQNKRIAQHLVVSEKTVRNTLTTINQKLGLDNREQAIVYYWGVPTPEQVQHFTFSN